MGYHIHFIPDTERNVCCDIVKIEQVIYNLINNAINYTGADKQVYVRQINKPDGVIIEVEDTGDGIEEDKIKLILSFYFKLIIFRSRIRNRNDHVLHILHNHNRNLHFQMLLTFLQLIAILYHQ